MSDRSYDKGFSVSITEDTDGYNLNLVRADGAIFMKRGYKSLDEATHAHGRLSEAWKLPLKGSEPYIPWTEEGVKDFPRAEG